VVFKKDGRPTHIAFIRKVEKTAGMVSAIYIVTKDAREGIYDHKLGFFLADAQGETNPLVAAMGYPYIYRVNYGNFDIDENYYKDCQEVPAEKKGIYSLKEVITDANVSYTEKDINANRYFFASTSYRDGSRFSFDMRLLSKMPAQVQPGTSFEIEVSIQSENAAALTDEGLHVNWYCGEQLLWRNSCDKEIRIGHDTKGIISEAREKLVVKVPECDGQKLICYFNRVRGYSLGEPTFMGWVKYIYEK